MHANCTTVLNEVRRTGDGNNFASFSIFWISFFSKILAMLATTRIKRNIGEIEICQLSNFQCRTIPGAQENANKKRKSQKLANKIDRSVVFFEGLRKKTHSRWHSTQFFAADTLIVSSLWPLGRMLWEKKHHQSTPKRDPNAIWTHLYLLAELFPSTVHSPFFPSLVLVAWLEIQRERKHCWSRTRKLSACLRNSKMGPRLNGP